MLWSSVVVGICLAGTTVSPAESVQQTEQPAELFVWMLMVPMKIASFLKQVHWIVFLHIEAVCARTFQTQRSVK